MLNRLIKEGIVTTIFGTMLLGIFLTMLWLGKIDMNNFLDGAGWLISAGLLFRSKDTLVGVTHKPKDSDTAG